MMAQLTIAETAKALACRDNFVILTHRHPDGDTLGSAAFLCRALRQLGKTAHVLENPDATDRYGFLLEGLTASAPESGDTLVAVDVAAPDMLPEPFRKWIPRIALRIDHHAASTPFAQEELVDGTAAACGQLLYDVLSVLGVTLDTDMADALYTAISTDTGRFSYANTQSHTFQVAAACAKATPHLPELNRILFETNTLAKLKMQGWLVENARFSADRQICVCPISLEAEQSIGVTEDDMENISGFPRTIDGVKIAATLRQQSNGTVKLSVRTVPGYDACAICTRFGGGGHRGAAGATLDMPLEQAVEAVFGAMPAME